MANPKTPSPLSDARRPAEGPDGAQRDLANLLAALIEGSAWDRTRAVSLPRPPTVGTAMPPDVDIRIRMDTLNKADRAYLADLGSELETLAGIAERLAEGGGDE